MKQFALAGNPNCGKTTLFNLLTGSTAYVGNWPGVTVDKKVGTYKKGAEPVQIVDLPGIYTAEGRSMEEKGARAALLADPSAPVLFVAECATFARVLPLFYSLCRGQRAAKCLGEHENQEGAYVYRRTEQKSGFCSSLSAESKRDL